MTVTKVENEAILWLKDFVEQLGFESNIILLHFDSQSVLHLPKNQIFHDSTKNISVRYHKLKK